MKLRVLPPATDVGWTMILEPRRPWLDLRLGELWHARDLILLFVRRDFVAAYKQTILGPLWFLIQPLLITLTIRRSMIFDFFPNLGREPDGRI